MTKTRWALAVALFGAGASCASGPTPTRAVPPVTPVPATARWGARRDTIHAVLSQNVRVVVVDGDQEVRSASGVVVGTGATPTGAVSYVMTNAHVVLPRAGERPDFRVLLDLPAGRSQDFAARVIALGSVPEVDLAVLAVPGIALRTARLAADDELSIGDEVVVIAAPYGHALSVSGGLVSQVDFDKASPRRPAMIKTDAAIGYGASGGGIFSLESGKLLGIVEGYRTAKVSIPLPQETYSFDVPMPGETFAAPGAKIRRFLEDHGLGALVEKLDLREPEGRPPPVAAN